VRVELGFVSSSSSFHPCLLSLPSFPLKNSELDDRRSMKLRIFEEEVRRLAEEEVSQRQEEVQQRQKEEED
jgi:hypothetical protein